ncbi:MAG TPA: serine/threonine-protein kinase [Kofleriaceae bacterium]|nr:serine/threonine-protein kinase [Kofleriaceae bacterium]
MSAAGDVIGPYRLIEPIGRGAMGEVWRARDERLDRLVAVKLLPPDVAGDPERRARMLREARAAAAVPHANVVTLFDIVQSEGRDVLVMELVEGHTVADLLRRDGPPPLERGLGWIISVADALRTAHARGILHRDIKAANVMVTKDGHVKVLDFGLARLADSPAVAPVATRRIASDASLAETVNDAPPPSRDDMALDATVASEPGVLTKPGSSSSEYATRAGTLLGTPMYMAPEQIAGEPPDERTEVFSVGVLAHEIVAGKPPFKARTVDELFAEISKGDAPRLEEPVPAQVSSLVAKAIAHDREARTASMAELHGALVATRDELYGKRVSRWPLFAAAALVVSLFIAAGVWWWTQPPPARPGDAYVTKALDEYDVFYGDKALSSLRAALRVDPTHPRALAYLVLFGGTDADRAEAVTRARALVGKTHGKDQALLRAVIALDERGPAAAREELLHAGADHELAFWAAEMAFKAAQYDLALPAYRDLYQANAKRFRGRIFDHYSGVLLLADEPATAVEVGRRYHDAYPGEADAVGVHATTLAIAGELDQALALAEESLSLARGEDTLAGLAKVRALRDELPQARELYAESLAMAPPARRPLRRAALGMLAWMANDQAAADAAVAPCLPGGADAAIHTRAACLFVAAAIAPDGDPRIATALAELEAMAAAATPTRPAYGAPASLALLVRARQRFAGGGCVRPFHAPAGELDAAAIERDLAAPIDFYASYHVPFFSTWAVCERAWLAHAMGDKDRALGLLRPVATRAPGRWWLDDDVAAMQK